MKPASHFELRQAAQDRANIRNPQLATFKLRGPLVQAADAAPWHKSAYKIHNAARKTKA
jgi:hypothetical protein